MAPPWLALGAALLAKKAIAASLYKAGAAYGWPKLYRRLLEVNRSATPPASRAAVRTALSSAFRLPQTAAAVLQDPAVRDFAAAVAATSTAKSLPLAPGVTLSTLIHAALNLPSNLVQSMASSVAKERPQK